MSIQALLESEKFFIALMFGSGICFIVYNGFLLYAKKAETTKNVGRPMEAHSARIVSRRPFAKHAPGYGFVFLFEYPDGSREEMLVSLNDAYKLVENDTGTLTHQGTRFVKFERTMVTDDDANT